MKKILVIAVLAFSVLGGVVGCGGGASTTKPATTK